MLVLTTRNRKLEAWVFLPDPEDVKTKQKKCMLVLVVGDNGEHLFLLYLRVERLNEHNGKQVASIIERALYPCKAISQSDD